MGARSSRSRGPGLNKSDGHLLEYFRQNFGAGGGGTNAERVGLEATGGNATNTYYDPDGFQYKAHIFTSSGSFVVDTPGDFDDEVDYLIIAGGGGGGSWVGGGGGAGGVISSHPDYPSAKRSSPQPVSVAGGPYAVVIGAGGVGWDIDNGSATATGTNGVNSSVFSKVASGGGVGGGWSLGQRKAGGSGAGGAYPSASSGAAGNLYPDAAPTPEALQGTAAPNQGNSGGAGVPGSLSTGGGGGAGAAGGDAVTTTSGDGGIGVQIKIAGAPTYTGTGRGDLNPGPGEYMWYAAGGGGGHHNGGAGPVAGTGGIGGGGDGLRADAARGSANSGLDGTGSGGGGNGGNNGNGHAGDGGDGIVIIRYRVK